tara:strand:+ start:1937 stop:2845 length:909 start_codon:yes stop_codon:yes gene_type:complete
MATEEVIQTVRETPEIEAYRIGLLESAKKLADQGITLPTQQVAGLTGLQEAARRQAEAGVGAFMPFVQQAGQTLGASGQTLGGVESALRAGAGPVTQEMIARNMNPFQQAIADEINRAYDRQLRSSAAGAVGAGAFGGSRGEIAASEIDRNRAAALAQAQAQNFMQAQQAAERELGRQTQLGQGIAALAGQEGQLGLRQAALGETVQGLGQRDVEGAFRIGQLLQAQDQARLDAQRQSDLAQIYEPYQRLGFLSDIYSKTPTTQQTITQSTSPNVSPFQQYLGLGIAGLSAAAGAQKAGLFG